MSISTPSPRHVVTSEQEEQRLIVCQCTAVTEGTVVAVIAAGARDEFDVAEACRAGSVCGGCVPTISRLLGNCTACPMEPSRVAQPQQAVG